MNAIRVGILGEFNEGNPTHLQTNDALRHTALDLGVPLVFEWLRTDQPHDFADYSALLCSPGSPYASIEGALEGVRFAREHGKPMLGTCGGFQHMVLEFARNVLGFEDASHAEYDPYGSRLIVRPLSCSLKGMSMTVHLKPESIAASSYPTLTAEERYYCDFGLNPEYEAELQRAGLLISGVDENHEARIVEAPKHPFFVGTLFVPQARSLPHEPHPLIRAFVEAAAQT